MYRDAPNHALYQGDLIVTPMTALPCDDPLLISLEPAAAPDPCSDCGAKPAGGTKKQRKYRPVSARIKKDEGAFRSSDSEDVVASVRTVLALIVSHSCDIDRQDYIRLAAVQGVENFLNGSQVDALRSGKHGNLSFVYLPPKGSLPEAVVNLDLQFFLPSRALGQRRRFRSMTGRDEPALAPYREVVDSRVTSLSESGLKRLYEAMIVHQTRPGNVAVTYDGFAPGAAVFADDPGRPQRADLPTRGWWWPTPTWLRRGAEQLSFPKTS